MQESKRKFLLMGTTCLIAIGLCVLLISRPSPNTDEAHRRNLQRYGDLYYRLNHVEHWLGRDIAKLVGVGALEKKYEHKCDDEREALVTSGYLVRLSAAVTNLNGRIKEIDSRFSNVGNDQEGLGLIAFDRQSNRITVICRPHDAPAYREALQKP